MKKKFFEFYGNEISPLVDKMKSNKKLYIFVFSILFTFFIYLFLFMKNPAGIQRYLFAGGFSDLCADFFNCCIHVSDKNPYFTDFWFQSNYLPIVNFLFYPLSKFADYRHFNLQDCWNSNIAVFTCFLFIFYSALLLVHSILCLCKKFNTDKLIIIPIIFSGIFLFTLERANILIFSTALLFYFISFYDSKNKILRYFSTFCLALVSCIKIYPVLFGIFYLVDCRRFYKQVIASFVLGIIFAFLPFLFFKHGFENLPRLIEILQKPALETPNCRYGFDCVINIVTNGSAMALSRFVHCFTYVLCAISLLLVFSSNNYLNKLLLIIFPVLYLPPFSYFYCSVYFIPALCFFMSSNDSSKKQIYQGLLLLFFYLMFVPIVLKPINGIGDYNLRFVIINCTCLLVWLSILINEILVFFRVKTRCTNALEISK